MDQILSSLPSLPQDISSIFSKGLFVQLTNQEKKILTIYSIAAAIFTAIFIFSAYYLKSHPLPKANFGPTPAGGKLNLPPHSLHHATFVRVQRSQPPALPPQGNSQVFNYLASSEKSSLDVMEDHVHQLLEDLKLNQQLLESFDSVSSIEEGENKDAANSQSIGTYEIDGKIFTYDDSEAEEIDALDDSKLDSISRKSEIENEIQKLEKEIEENLAKYPQEIKKYFIDRFSSFSKKDSHEMYDHLVQLSGFMDIYKEHTEFIHDCLRQIESFLATSLFTSSTELCLQETKKMDLIVFHEFQSIANKHLKSIDQKDPDLALKLKLKLANLPLRDQEEPPLERKNLFPNIYLSESDQIAVLANHFQLEENKYVTLMISQIQSRNFFDKDLNKLSKMISDDRGYLSLENKVKLQNELEKAVNEKFQGKSNEMYSLLKAKLSKNGGNSIFGGSALPTQLYPYQNHYGSYPVSLPVSPQCDLLYRASKAKSFFKKQVGLSDDAIQVPRWYHTTHGTSVLPIIQSGQIRVEHKKAFKGAWVSTQIEALSFGNCALVLSHRISKLDKGNVFIGFEGGYGVISQGVRWRGLQCPIHLMDSNKASHTSFIAIPKSRLKTEKPQILKALQDAKVDSTVVSVEQIKYMQAEIIKTIGNPNLTEKWWGKADVSLLEKIHSSNHS